MVKAINYFNYALGYRFSTYAYHYIRGEILNRFREQRRIHALPTESLDEALERGTHLENIIADNSLTPAEEVVVAETNERLRLELEERLGLEMADIIIQAWGLEGDAKTIEEIAQDVGMPQSEIHELLERAQGQLSRDLNFIKRLQAEDV